MREIYSVEDDKAICSRYIFFGSCYGGIFFSIYLDIKRLHIAISSGPPFFACFYFLLFTWRFIYHGVIF